MGIIDAVKYQENERVVRIKKLNKFTGCRIAPYWVWFHPVFDKPHGACGGFADFDSLESARSTAIRYGYKVKICS